MPSGCCHENHKNTGVSSTEVMVCVSSHAPVCSSTPPEGRAVSAAPCLDRQLSSIPAWIAVIPQQPFVGANWCWCPKAPPPPRHNLQPAGIKQGLFRGSQACRAQPRWAACPLPPGTHPAAQHRRRSGREHVGGHDIQRHRQDQSEYLPPAHPCRALGRRQEEEALRDALLPPHCSVCAGRAVQPHQHQC